MPKAYKPLDETSGENRPCLRCFNCKTRVFRDLTEMIRWCEKKDLHFSYAWKKKFIKEKMLQIYWCTKSQTKPRIYRSSDNPFVIHCKQFNGGDIDGITGK